MVATLLFAGCEDDFWKFMNVTLLKRNEELARENGQLQAENAELKKEVARLGSAPTASAMVASG